jgi:hypothetical protein
MLSSIALRYAVDQSWNCNCIIFERRKSQEQGPLVVKTARDNRPDIEKADYMIK